MRNQPEPARSESNKPEWFELLDGDAPSAQVTKINKKLPIAAVLVTGLVIASGAFFSGASAENSTDQSAVAAVDQITEPTVTPTVQSTTPNSPTVANPSEGVPAPGGGRGGDEFEDRDGDFEGEFGERHERGEGRDRDHDRDDDNDEDDD